jgi:CRISPR-associated protein Cmr5
MLTRDQKYAISAHEKVQQRAKEPEAKSYGVMVHKLSILIHTAGLAQALAFVDARSSKEIQKHLLDDLAETVGKKDKTALLKAARESQLVEYILFTKQILNALLWYKRFAQSILNVDVGDITDEEDTTHAS